MRPERVIHQLAEIPGSEPALVELGLPAEPLVLRRAWPHADGGLALEFTGSGTIASGIWYPGRGAERRWRERDGEAIVDLDGEAIVLHAPGKDRRLPALAGAVSAQGATIVGHRAERRAVVAVPGAYVKVVRPGRVARLAAAHRAATARVRDVTVPQVLAADDEAGTVVLEAIPGVSLHDLLARPAHAERHLRAAGSAIARFHAAPVPRAPHHGPREEAVVLEGWIERLRAYDSDLFVEIWNAARPVLTALAALAPVPAASLHRDLHDKQILICPEGVGLIDLDTSAPGDPAIDVANLVVHMRLRDWQSHSLIDPELAREAILEGYGASGELRSRLDVYERATALRLACVYAFRPSPGRGLAQLLINRARRATAPPALTRPPGLRRAQPGRRA